MSFGLFRSQFDPSMGYRRALSGAAAQAYSKGQIRGMAALQIAVAVFMGPFLNVAAGAGEELGWRGLLYPALRRRLAPVPACLLGGVIWGVWHARPQLWSGLCGISVDGGRHDVCVLYGCRHAAACADRTLRQHLARRTGAWRIECNDFGADDVPALGRGWKSPAGPHGGWTGGRSAAAPCRGGLADCKMSSIWGKCRENSGKWCVKSW